MNLPRCNCISEVLDGATLQAASLTINELRGGARRWACWEMEFEYADTLSDKITKQQNHLTYSLRIIILFFLLDHIARI